MRVRTIAPGAHRIDLNYLGQPLGIATAVLESSEGLLLVDPGPASSLDGLEAGLAGLGMGLADVTALLLTHIHLDHAGAAGTLASSMPGLAVYVHQRGAPHLVDPQRLLDSAFRIYGDALDRLFGAVVPVDARRVRALEGGETLRFGERTIRVEDAPGHAVHHVMYLDEATGTAFVGDTAGERFAPSDYVLPVTPPPDIDLEAWSRTLARLRALAPARLFLTHFDAADDAAAHLDRLTHNLDVWARRVQSSLREPGEDAGRAAAFVEWVSDEIRARVPERVVDHYLGSGLADSWYGLARYWRKRAGAAADRSGIAT